MLTNTVTSETLDIKKKWKIDTAHSNINFSVSHMVISEVTGTFKEFEGTVLSSKDDFSDAQINVSINAKSINTENNDRDNHLRSGDFFNTEIYSSLEFKSTGIEALNNGHIRHVHDRGRGTFEYLDRVLFVG